MKLTFVRHGQTAWNMERKTQGRTDIPLDDIGLRQSGLIAKRLKNKAITRVYTSPLKRALQTALAIASLHELTPIVSPNLLEQHFGDWEGMPLDSLTYTFPGQMERWWQDPFASTPDNGESLREVQTRCLALLEEIRANAKDADEIIVVGHSIPLRLMIAELLALPAERIHNFRLDNTSVTEFRILEDRAILTCLNDTSHLLKEKYA